MTSDERVRNINTSGFYIRRISLRNVNSYIVDFFKLEIRQKKRDFLSEKRESGMRLKKREFTPESGSVDTYDM